MVTYCVDASAALRFLDGEEGSEQVAKIILSCAADNARLIVSAIQWGEIAAVTLRRGTERSVSEALSRLTELGFQAVTVSPGQAIEAAKIQHQLKIPYADAFLVALTREQDQATLVTADFDFKAAEHRVTIEFLRPKTPLS